MCFVHEYVASQPYTDLWTLSLTSLFVPYFLLHLSFLPHPLLPSPPPPPSAPSPPPAAGHGHTRHTLYTRSPPKHLSKAQLSEGSGSSANPLRLLWLHRRPAEVAQTVRTQTQTHAWCAFAPPTCYIYSRPSWKFIKPYVIVIHIQLGLPSFVIS